MPSELLENLNNLKAVPADNFDELLRAAKSAANKAQDSYEAFCKQENAPRELLEALRLNITTFILSLEKFTEAPDDQKKDLKAYCESYLNSLQILIRNI